MLRVSVRKRRGGFLLDAHFEAPTPGITAIFGRSGGGKTTLVETIAGLLAADAGQIQLDGTEWLSVGEGRCIPAERRRIGYVFQDARLFPHLTVAGNLKYGFKRARESQIGFDDVVSLLSLAPLLSRRPGQLSGGERQRVALGRALLSQPRLLLLDEPLASLDVARREEVLPYLEALRDAFSIPMIYVSHQLDEVLRLATHIVLLESGRVIAQGSPRAISLDPQLSAIVGREAMGAMLEGTVAAYDSVHSVAELIVGGGRLKVSASHARVGAPARVQLLARDVIIATEPPRALSVRNVLSGRIENMTDDGPDAQRLRVDVGGAVVLARVTRDAVLELGLKPALPVWVLVKAVSTRIL